MPYVPLSSLGLCRMRSTGLILLCRSLGAPSGQDPVLFLSGPPEPDPRPSASSVCTECGGLDGL